MFEFDGFSILFVIINMLVLFFGLKHFLFKPVNKVLDARKAKAQADLDGAARAQREAENLKQSYQEHLARAKEEAQAILDDSRKRAESERQKAVAATREQATLIIENAKQSVEIERGKMRRELSNETSELVLDVAAKILAENADTAHNRAVLDRLLAAGK